MEILLTGNTCFVTPAWVEMAFPEDHVLITCARGQPHPPRIRTITLDSKERIGQLVDSYEFDRIVYFSEHFQKSDSCFYPLRRPGLSAVLP